MWVCGKCGTAEAYLPQYNTLCRDGFSAETDSLQRQTLCRTTAAERDSWIGFGTSFTNTARGAFR